MKTRWNYELDLKDLLSDPLVNMLMSADQVDPRELREKLNRKAKNLPHPKPRLSSLAECCCG